MIRYVLTCCLCVCSCLAAVYGQTLKGKVIDEATSEPLPFANVVLVEEKDGADGFRGTVTDAEGCFALEAADRKAKVKVSYLGYVTKVVELTQGVVHTIALKEDERMLGEVVVKGKRNLFSMENGGIATDVANSPLKHIGTASDVLGKLPFVVKDGNSVSVLGKGAPLIYINNRLVRNGNELERLSSEHIKKVTVVTNPGPEYAATVGAVVLIEAVRPPGEGIGGEVFGRVNVRHRASENGSVYLNYRKNRLDLFAGYWYGDYRWQEGTTLLRRQVQGQDVLQVKTGAEERSQQRTHDVEAGLNYEFNEKHSAGARYSYGHTPYQRTSSELYTDVVRNEVAEEHFGTASTVKPEGTSHLLNVYYVGSPFAWLRAQLDLDYATGERSNRQLSASDREEAVRVSTRSLRDYDLYAGRLSLFTPLWGDNLKYGVEFSRTTNRQHYLVDEAEGAEGIVPNENTAEQTFWAAFVGYGKTLGKWNLNAGLRYEYVDFAYFANGRKLHDESRNYADLFPTASVSYRDKWWQMMLSYRSTTRRPSYNQLRNSVQYDDPYTYEAGNPYLKPMRTDDLSFSFLWRDVQFMTSYKFYRHRMPGIPELYEENPDIIIYRQVDLKHARDLSVSLYYTPKFGCWRPTAGVGLSKEYITFRGHKYNDPYLFYTLQNTFHLPADFTLMVDFQGNTNGHSSLNKIYSSFVMGARLMKTFMDGNLILNLYGGDLLGTARRKALQEVHPVSILLRKEAETRFVEFSIRYKFNTTRSKYKGESASSAERNRL